MVAVAEEVVAAVVWTGREGCRGTGVLWWWKVADGRSRAEQPDTKKLVCHWAAGWLAGWRLAGWLAGLHPSETAASPSSTQLHRAQPSSARKPARISAGSRPRRFARPSPGPPGPPALQRGRRAYLCRPGPITPSTYLSPALLFAQAHLALREACAAISRNIALSLFASVLLPISPCRLRSACSIRSARTVCRQLQPQRPHLYLPLRVTPLIYRVPRPLY